MCAVARQPSAKDRLRLNSDGFAVSLSPCVGTVDLFIHIPRQLVFFLLHDPGSLRHSLAHRSPVPRAAGQVEKGNEKEKEEGRRKGQRAKGKGWDTRSRRTRPPRLSWVNHFPSPLRLPSVWLPRVLVSASLASGGRGSPPADSDVPQHPLWAGIHGRGSNCCVLKEACRHCVSRRQ